MLELHTPYTATCIHVPDADDLTLWMPHTHIRIRLAHIDAPESGQPYASIAQRTLRSLALNREINFRIIKWDNYGRAIADTQTATAGDLSALLLKLGLAWWYRKYCRHPYYGQLEHHAREKKLGLWAEPNPEPPWSYRATARRRTKRT